jgi:pantothenate kinase
MGLSKTHSLDHSVDALLVLLRTRVLSEKPEDPVSFVRELLRSQLFARDANVRQALESYSLSRRISPSKQEKALEYYSAKSLRLSLRDPGLCLLFSQGSCHFLEQLVSFEIGQRNVRVLSLEQLFRFKQFHQFQSLRPEGCEHCGSQTIPVLNSSFVKFLHSESSDELSTLISIISILLTSVGNDLVSSQADVPHFQNNRCNSCKLGCNHSEAKYPYLVVSIGAGVSFLLVKSRENFERIGGSAIGAGTYLALTKILTDSCSLSDAVSLASQGDSTKVDMLVGDIYGGDYRGLNLAASKVASSFGRLGISLSHPGYESRVAMSSFSHSDVSASLLRMISLNIAQLAFWCAAKHQTEKVILSASVLRSNRFGMSNLAFSIDLEFLESVYETKAFKQELKKS